MKIIKPYNLLSTDQHSVTVALWLENDDYDTVQKCAGAVYEQLTQLQTIKHALNPLTPECPRPNPDSLASFGSIS